jgi:hypothetical protein
MRGLKPAAAALSSLVVNPIEASLEAIKEAGYPAPLVVKRRLDPQIKQLNAAGYLNGHTPFSALLSFISALVAYRNNFQIVLSSNEASASEGNTNYLGFEINHQYSKSLHYEELFRRYLSQQNIPVNYLSFLRPLNELQICGLFSALKQQHAIFRSCNREQTDAARARLVGSAAPTRAGWCAKCPKCVFTYLCLRCFLSADEVKAIFGVDPSELGEFTQLSRELAGLSEHKPFECVGTFGEVQTCLTQLFANRALSTNDNTDLSDLRQKVAKLTPEPLTAALKHWNRNNFLSPQLAELVSSALANVTMGSR